MTAENDADRKAFEAWFRWEYPHACTGYCSTRWEGWQAGAAHARQPGEPGAYVQKEILDALRSDKHATGTVCSGLLKKPFGDPVPLYAAAHPAPPALVAVPEGWREALQAVVDVSNSGADTIGFLMELHRVSKLCARVLSAAPAAEVPPSSLDQPCAWWAETGTAGAGEGCNKPFWLRHEAIDYVRRHGGYVAPLFRRYDAPAAEEFRRGAEAMRERCAWTATSFLVGDPANGVPLRSPGPHQIADAIRALPIPLTSGEG